MATITVSSNPSTSGDTLTVNFTTDATNISDILLSKDGGSTYISATSFTSSKAVFNVSSWDNGTYSNCKLKCVYTQSGGGTTDTYYTITYTLNQATSSNSTTSIKKGSSYSTIVAANEGYNLKSVSVVMGGTDISSSVVRGSNINIPNVTGNITITVTTEAIVVTPETLTISNISNITQTEQTEFYIDYSTNIAVVKHEVSWDGGNTFYDKTSDVEASGTRYRFKHDNQGSAGTYQMAIRVTTAKGTTKTSNVFTLTLESKAETGTIGHMTYGKGINQSTHIITDNAECWATVNPVTVEKGATYTLQMDGTWVWGYAFDDSDNYVSDLFTSNGNNNYTFTFTAPTTKIRYGCYDPSKYLTYCTLTKTSGGSSGGGDTTNTEYATSCTSAYILDKMYPMPQNHEALPSGVNDTWATQSRWENQQRPTAIAHNCGQSGCPGAVAFRALGAWANVYRVKDKGFSANTGVEMRNIKVYGWYNGQWEKVQDMAVPDGNFYAESFSGDSNTYFSDSIKTTSTSKTIILREANKVNGENCMYHPFSKIKNFDVKYQYVYTCIDLRKVKWNESGTDDRDSSHYCASCGGDWWLAEGLTFDSSWQHNKGVAQPKMIEITKEWRRFSMTTVPQGWTNGFPQ